MAHTHTPRPLPWVESQIYDIGGRHWTIAEVWMSGNCSWRFWGEKPDSQACIWEIGRLACKDA